MRISDWSSDVCSSDLVEGDLDLLDARVRDADRTDQSLLLQGGEGPHDVGVHAPAVGAVVLVQIELIDPEDRKRALHPGAQLRLGPVTTPALPLPACAAALDRKNVV